jgi:ATP-dependent Clp protease ATP-binding subunit ClpB
MFKPEFLNRLDDQIIFNSLGREEILQIVDLQLERLQRRIADRGMRIELSPEAKQLLADQGFDPAFGARPLKRALQQKVLDPLALELLEGHFVPGQVVRVEAEGDRVVLRAGKLTGAESA